MLATGVVWRMSVIEYWRQFYAVLPDEVEIVWCECTSFQIFWERKGRSQMTHKFQIILSRELSDNSLRRQRLDGFYCLVKAVFSPITNHSKLFHVRPLTFNEPFRFFLIFCRLVILDDRVGNQKTPPRKVQL